MSLFDFFSSNDYLITKPFYKTFKTFIDGLNEELFFGDATFKEINKKEYALISNNQGIITFKYKKDSILIKSFLPNCFNEETNYTFWGTNNVNISTQRNMVKIFMNEANRI